ncbi:MAG: nucleoside triphosphate pyrophosphohydrolase [Spirochaetaceae bacterium]|jgi:tetrapyrrole methylase family protein/MazG family protein|nr:nucleoside triphosphate pyrophosphohydrolase [Spirochaetaceae bacterium]
MEYGKAFTRLCGIVKRLRGEGGCPWDREQSPQSLRGDLAEETYECIEAINEGDPAHIREELGDLFLLVTMISYMHQQEGLFTISDVLGGISEKLIRRHPHVFGGAKAENSATVLENWARIKVEQEGRKPRDSALDEVSRSLPPLERAFKLQQRAAKKGFDWPQAGGVLNKLREEVEEVAAAAKTVTVAVAAAETAATTAAAVAEEKDALEEELGDLLFSVINLCRFFAVDPALALGRTNGKFIRRFEYVEKCMKENALEMKTENLEAMDRFWDEAKRLPQRSAPA